MKNKFIAGLLCGLMVLGVAPISANAEWKQNSDNSWSYSENGKNTWYGWKEIDNNWYYFELGKMKTGWLCTGYYYYLGSDGAMKTGWVNDGGKRYYLKSDGQLATDTTIEGTYVNKYGVAQPKENQKVLLDNKYVKITYLGFNDTGYSKQLKVQVDNKTSNDLVIDNENVVVDNFNICAMFTPTVTANASRITAIEFNNSDITTDFKTIKGKFKICNSKCQEIEKDNFSITL